MLGITSTYDGRFKFVIAEGESAAGLIPATGNTNTRGVFKPDVVTFLRRWLAEGPTHHFALGIGHHAQTIKKIGDALGIESVVVTGDGERARRRESEKARKRESDTDGRAGGERVCVRQ